MSYFAHIVSVAYPHALAEQKYWDTGSYQQIFPNSPNLTIPGVTHLINLIEQLNDNTTGYHIIDANMATIHD